MLISDILHVIGNGMSWKDGPKEVYGPYTTFYKLAACRSTTDVFQGKGQIDLGGRRDRDIEPEGPSDRVQEKDRSSIASAGPAA